MKIYLINPKTELPYMFGEEFLEREIIFIADNSLPTVAACIPKDWEVQICDERATAIDYNTDAQWIGITGRIGQHNRMLKLAKQFKELGKKVMIGGAFAARFSERIKPFCDIIIKGEIENMAKEVFDDIKNNNYKHEYDCALPNPLSTPIPRWDLYPYAKTMIGTIQFSRGCPFKCDFCDVVNFNGSKSRFKPIEDILKELDVLYYDCKFQTIFIVDDNVIGNVPFAKELFKRISIWKEYKNISFIVQAPVLLTKDRELLKLSSDAGIKQMYIGVETFDEELLKKMNKYHNLLNLSPIQSVNNMLEHGILPMVGFILGFDEHTKDIFETTYKCAMTLSAPIIYLSALTAYPNTVLYKKFEAEERLHCDIEKISGASWDSNIIPKNMTKEELREGTYRLFQRLYSPASFKERLINCLRKIKIVDNTYPDNFDLSYTVIDKLKRYSEEDRELCKYLIRNHKRHLGYIFRILMIYAQMRYITMRPYERN